MKSRLLSYFLFELNFLLVFLLIHVGLHLDVTFLDAILILPLTNTWTAKLFKLSRDYWLLVMVSVSSNPGWAGRAGLAGGGGYG